MKLILSSITQKKLLALFCILVVLNFPILVFTAVDTSRWARLLGTLLFFGFYIFKVERPNTGLTLAFLFFTVKDVCIHFYEQQVGLTGFLIFGILAYIALIAHLLPHMKTIPIGRLFILISLLLVAANGYTLKLLIGMMDTRFGSSGQVFLFLLYGSLMMLLTIIAVTYNNGVNSTRSMFFVYLTAAFLLSDIASLFAYYFGFTTGFYIDRVAYILAMGLLVNHGLNTQMFSEEQDTLALYRDDIFALDLVNASDQASALCASFSCKSHEHEVSPCCHKCRESRELDLPLRSPSGREPHEFGLPLRSPCGRESRKLDLPLRSPCGRESHKLDFAKADIKASLYTFVHSDQKRSC